MAPAVLSTLVVFTRLPVINNKRLDSYSYIGKGMDTPWRGVLSRENFSPACPGLWEDVVLLGKGDSCSQRALEII